MSAKNVTSFPPSSSPLWPLPLPYSQSTLPPALGYFSLEVSHALYACQGPQEEAALGVLTCPTSVKVRGIGK